MALGDFKLFKENAGGSFDERTVAAAPGKVFSWDANHDPQAIEVVPFAGASKDVDLNGKDLTNVANLGVGTKTPLAMLHFIQDGSGNYLYFDKYVSGVASAIILQRKARGSLLSPTAAQDNDVGGGFIVDFHDGADFGRAAAIRVRATQNISPGKHGAKIVLETVANDTTALTERMVIQHDGKVGIGTTAPLRTLDVNGNIEATDYYHSNFKGKTQRVEITDATGTHIMTFSGGLLVDYEIV